MTLTTGVFAHDGHGLTGAHWHASDSWGLLVAAVAVALVVFGGRR